MNIDKILRTGPCLDCGGRPVPG